MNTEANLIAALAEAYHTESMVFVSAAGATIHTTLDQQENDHVVDVARRLPHGFYRLARSPGIELGELVQVSDGDAIAALVAAGMDANASKRRSAIQRESLARRQAQSRVH